MKCHVTCCGNQSRGTTFGGKSDFASFSHFQNTRWGSLEKTWMKAWRMSSGSEEPAMNEPSEKTMKPSGDSSAIFFNS